MEIQKWEYKCEWTPLYPGAAHPFSDAALDRFGADGRELVSAFTSDQTQMVALVFKRPILDD